MEQPLASANSSALQTYYREYLVQIRGLSEASVRHYLDALRNISTRLQAKGLVKTDIYEIADIKQLELIRDILNADPDYVALNTRGNNMYGSGLNNYIRFAQGEDFDAIHGGQITKLDAPLAPPEQEQVTTKQYHRSNILKTQAIESANYACELGPGHQTFLAEKTQHPYMEAHHAMPMHLQGEFAVSLDVYANLICLCPVCHRRIHYGLTAERRDMVTAIYASRAERLANSGIHLSQEEFVEKAICNN